MVGRRLFPFGAQPFFRGELLGSGRVNLCIPGRDEWTSRSFQRDPTASRSGKMISDVMPRCLGYEWSMNCCMCVRRYIYTIKTISVCHKIFSIMKHHLLQVLLLTLPFFLYESNVVVRYPFFFWTHMTLTTCSISDLGSTDLFLQEVRIYSPSFGWVFKLR